MTSPAENNSPQPTPNQQPAAPQSGTETITLPDPVDFVGDPEQPTDRPGFQIVVRDDAAKIVGRVTGFAGYKRGYDAQDHEIVEPGIFDLHWVGVPNSEHAPPKLGQALVRRALEVAHERGFSRGIAAIQNAKIVTIFEHLEEEGRIANIHLYQPEMVYRSIDPLTAELPTTYPEVSPEDAKTYLNAHLDASDGFSEFSVISLYDIT